MPLLDYLPIDRWREPALVIAKSPIRLAILIIKAFLEIGIFLALAPALRESFIRFGLDLNLPAEFLSIPNVSDMLYGLVLLYLLRYGTCSIIPKHWILPTSNSDDS